MLRTFPILLFAITALCTSAACGPDLKLPVERRTQALGEPVGDHPAYEERLVHYFTNRARTEPTAFNPDEPYEPTPPLAYDFDLARAARFHAQHIVDQDCWCEDHSSCCSLEGTGEATTCGGATTGCGAESSEDRVARWSPAYTGENMALGQSSAWQAVDGWIHSSGHWQNINSPRSTKIGVGFHPNAWVQDFGSGGTLPVIGDGIHFADGQTTRFGTTYYQPGTGGPRTALVIVDGECRDLELTYGEPELGAFETAISLEPGCHRYYFHFTDGDGDDHTYPSFGSFGAGVGEECPFFIDTRPADTCSPSGQTCETGDTRRCYTGPFGTEDVGICEAGVERCIGGQWTGECRLEVLPGEETCDNDTDDNCDGEVDEGCGAEEDGAPDDDSETNEETEDGTGRSDEPSTKSDPGGGCSSAPTNSPMNVFWLLAFAVFARRARKRE